jgi:hypothetical protein
MFKMFENRVLGRRFGHKLEKVTGGWNKVSKKELCNL